MSCKEKELNECKTKKVLFAFPEKDNQVLQGWKTKRRGDKERESVSVKYTL